MRSLRRHRRYRVFFFLPAAGVIYQMVALSRVCRHTDTLLAGRRVDALQSALRVMFRAR